MALLKRCFHSLFFVAGLFFASSILLGGGYLPPSSPPLYAKEDPQNPPLKVKDSIGAKPFVSIGQSKSTGSEGAATSMNYGFGLQYVKPVNHWNLILAEADLIRGFAGNSRADIGISYGLSLKAGYGFKIGQELFAILGGGVMVFKSHLVGEEATALGLASTSGDGLGSGAVLYYKFGMPMNESSFLTVGLSSSFINASYNSMQFASGAKASSQNIALTVLAADVGCAFQF